MFGESARQQGCGLEYSKRPSSAQAVVVVSREVSWQQGYNWYHRWSDVRLYQCQLLDTATIEEMGLPHRLDVPEGGRLVLGPFRISYL